MTTQQKKRGGMRKVRISTEDRLFSEFIRKRAIRISGGCQRCLSPKHDILKEDDSIFPAWKQLQCSHLWGRRNRATRWDQDNCVGLCSGCHAYFTANPIEHQDWFREHLGEERFEQLQLRAQGVKKVDIVVVRLYLNQLLKSEVALA